MADRLCCPHTLLLKLGVEGVIRRPRPAWSCHCWSQRERAAHGKELSLSSNRRQGQRQGWEGVGNPREGRAAVSQTGPGQGHETCPCASRSEWHRDMPPHPCSPLGVSPEVLLGGWRLCPAMGVNTWWRRREQERNTG